MAISGTSTVTPHVASVVTLILKANPDLKPDEVKQLLIATADEMVNPDTGEPYAAFEVGAALVDADGTVELASQAPPSRIEGGGPGDGRQNRAISAAKYFVPRAKSSSRMCSFGAW